MASKTKLSKWCAFNFAETLTKDYRTQEILLNTSAQLQPKSSWNYGWSYTMFLVEKTASEVHFNKTFGSYCTIRVSCTF